MKEIDVKTQLVCLLGYPLEHSFSPAMQNKGFLVRGLNYYYLPIQVKETDLPDVVKGIAKMNFAGFNVTLPYKIKILEFMDELDELAEIIGAVNTVTIKKGRIKGYNTDGIGFFRSLEEKTGLTVKGQSFFILGSGGAARAIACTAVYKQARKVYICNRTYTKAQDLAEEINRKIRPCCQPLSFEDAKQLSAALAETRFLINTTSVGMYPQIEEMPINKEYLRRELVVCDIVYNPVNTRLLQEAAKLGCETITGLGMLLYQGTESFKLWTGQEAPVEAMREELEKISAGAAAR